MANVNDVLTALQNTNTALSTLSSTWRRGQGNLTSVTVTTQTLITTSPGRLVSFNVLVVGSGNGTINNSASTANAAAANALVATPQTLGTFPVGAEFNTGLVISPGTGQSINVTYYVGP